MTGGLQTFDLGSIEVTGIGSNATGPLTRMFLTYLVSDNHLMSVIHGDFRVVTLHETTSGAITH